MIFAYIGQALCGWLLADFLGGAFHWWEDRLASEDMPVIGSSVIIPNRLHHRDPIAFTRGTLVGRNLATWIAVLAVSAVWLLITGPNVMWLVATLGGLAMNEVHVLAHVPVRCGPFLRVCQEIGILQSPPHHAGHHRPPQDRRYCVLTNWTNPVLDAVHFWAHLETLLTRLGLEPNRGTR